MTSQLITAAKHNLERENLVISIACSIVLAAIVLAFIVRATN